MEEQGMSDNAPRYRKLADALEDAVKQGAIAAGQRLPSVRALAQAEGVSISTALSAYRDLEQRGVVEARPKSGYYARAACCLPILESRKTASRPVEVTTTGLMQAFTREATEFKGVAFGAALPAHSLLPVRDLARAVTAAMHREGNQAVASLEPLGLPMLRQYVAARMLNAGCRVSPDEVVITNGCSEAVSLALQATTKPGDVVAVECPSFYGTLLAVHGLGRRVLEIETSPITGLSVDAFERACRNAPPRALIVSPSGQNPTGACMSDVDKLRLLELANQYNITVIEDDVFGELARDSGLRKWALLSRDTESRVVYCSSFSKVLAPGFRIGWILPGRFQDQVRSSKIIQTWGGPNVMQRALVRMLKAGSLENRIRHLVRETDATRRQALAIINETFPKGVAVANTQYGYLLWIRLPGGVDTLKLYQQSVRELGINFAPGSIFSATGQFSDYLRLNLAAPWNEALETALRQLGHFLSQNTARPTSVMA